MSAINEGGSAFPNDGQWANGYPEGGMSLRDWFAGQVVAGMVAGGRGLDISVKQFAEVSYSIADAMIVERAKGPLS